MHARLCLHNEHAVVLILHSSVVYYDNYYSECGTPITRAIIIITRLYKCGKFRAFSTADWRKNDTTRSLFNFSPQDLYTPGRASYI